MNTIIVVVLSLVAALPPEQRVKRDDPDHEEMLRMDERARVRERNESMRTLSDREKALLRAARFETFIKDVDALAAGIDQPNGLRRRLRRMESFLIEGTNKPLPKASPVAVSTRQQKNEFIRRMVSDLLPLLNELKGLERQSIVDLSKRKAAIAQLRTMEVLTR